MTIDYTGLIIDSDALTDSLVELEESALANLEDIDFHKDVFEKRKADFYINEHNIPPVGGVPKWNDKRRDAFISQEYAQEEGNLVEAEKAYRRTQMEIKKIGTKISGLNRKIRLLELAAGINEARLE